jgi:hypothetical protein
LVSRIGDPFAGRAPTSFIGPHGLTVDSHGDLYVAEVCWTLWPGLFPDEPRPTICAPSKNISASTKRDCVDCVRFVRTEHTVIN